MGGTRGSPRSPVRSRFYGRLRAGWAGDDQEDPELESRVQAAAWLIALRFAARQLGRFGRRGQDLPWVRDAISFVQGAWPGS